jgi:hypothetical protein
MMDITRSSHKDLKLVEGVLQIFSPVKMMVTTLIDQVISERTYKYSMLNVKLGE